jgi:hypothetical protein
MGSIHLQYVQERAHHYRRYNGSLRRMGTDVSQHLYRSLSHLQANTRITVATEKCLYLDDMAGAHCFVCNGTGELFASSQDHKTK